VKVDYNELMLAQQLVERQGAVHATAMTEYVGISCRLQPLDLGLILMQLYPLVEVSVQIGTRVFEGASNLANSGAEALSATIDDYVESDREEAAAFSLIAARLGMTTEPFKDPRHDAPSLGPAQSSAPSDWGDAEPWIFGQAADEGSDLGQYIRDTAGRAGDRVDHVLNGGGVVERSNPSSYLTAPHPQKSEIESLRWSAGPLLGGVDWIFEQFFHFSLLEDVIMKPFAGNWEAIEGVSIAWTNLGRASFEMAGNFSGLPSQCTVWSGEASERFRASSLVMAGALTGVSAACDYVSGLVSIIVAVSKAAASAIGFALNMLVKHLLTLAAEAAVPVIGWVAAAIEVGLIIIDIVNGLRLIYNIVDLIYDAIYSFIEAKERLVDSIFLIEDLIESLARTGVRLANA
jgi:hypothetical protein